MVQRSMLHKGLIKYNKTNIIIPMNIHARTTHLRLFAQRK